MKRVILSIACLSCSAPPAIVDAGQPDAAPPIVVDAGFDACPIGTTLCGDECVDVATDNANCGKCGAACTNGWACKAGACSIGCSMGQTWCGACVDTLTDTSNCGSCGNGCAMGDQCMQGVCCQAGKTICNGACSDMQLDPKNCGSCGTQCSMSTPYCWGGTCSASLFLEVFPSSGILKNAGSFYGGRYYTMTFSKQTTILAVEWNANLASIDTIRGEIWSLAKQKLATGNVVNGTNMQAFQRSTINFVAAPNTPYLVGVFMSNPSTFFPYRDTPGYPFTIGPITVSAAWATVSTADVFPASANSWAPDFRVEIQ